MEKASGSGSNPVTRFGFGFSWADEVEREEQEQLAVVEKQGAEAKKEQKKTRADPFCAARPREVVLAEKGIDWRARDREIDAAAARHVAVSASIRGRTAPPPARAPMATPTRCAAWDRGSWRTPAPRRGDVESTPQAKDASPDSRSPWHGGKRMCTGEVPALAHPAPVAGDQGTRVLSEINGSEGCGSLFQGAAKKSFNLRGIEKEGNKANEAAVVDCGCSATAASATATEDQSTVGQKRKGRKRGRRGGSKKTENQQPLLI